MRKTAIIKKLTALPGFKKNGAYYIGTCNNDVIAGYCLDAPPASIYVWRFLVPSYDNIDFLHMALGKRILISSRIHNENKDNIDITALLLNDWKDFSETLSGGNLISYIDSENLEGTYALWVRYITNIKNKNFEKAEHVLEADGIKEKFLEMQAVKNSFVSLCKEKDANGWEGCLALLRMWQHRTKATYCLR